MSRPVKEYRTKTASGSLQLYKQGEYIGSIPYHELCQIIKERKDNGKPGVLANPEFIKERATKEGSGKQNTIRTNGAAHTRESSEYNIPYTNSNANTSFMPKQEGGAE